MNQNEEDNRYINRLKDMLLSILWHNPVLCFEGYFSPDGGDFCVPTNRRRPHPMPVKFIEKLDDSSGLCDAVEPCSCKYTNYWRAIPEYSYNLNSVQSLEWSIREDNLSAEYMIELGDIVGTGDLVFATAGQKAEAVITIKVRQLLAGQLVIDNNLTINEICLKDQAIKALDEM